MMSVKSLCCFMPHELQKGFNQQKMLLSGDCDYSHQLTGRGRTQAGSVRYVVGRYEEMHR